jgi:hypothetical protein
VNMRGYRAVELVEGSEYGVELDARAVISGIASWGEACELANTLNGLANSDD